MRGLNEKIQVDCFEYFLASSKWYIKVINFTLCSLLYSTLLKEKTHIKILDYPHITQDHLLFPCFQDFIQVWWLMTEFAKCPKHSLLYWWDTWCLANSLPREIREILYTFSLYSWWELCVNSSYFYIPNLTQDDFSRMCVYQSDDLKRRYLI